MVTFTRLNLERVKIGTLTDLDMSHLKDDKILPKVGVVGVQGSIF